MDLRKLFTSGKIKADSDLGQMHSYLESIQYQPSVRISGGMDDGESGRYSSYDNAITLNANNPEKLLGGLNHEYNHATLDGIRGSLARLPRSNYGMTGSERQLKDAWEKLLYNKTKLNIGTNDEYRTEPEEYLSFGVGNMNIGGGRPTYPVNPHVDATAATESAILRDLALRAQKDPRKNDNRMHMALKDLFRF